MRKRTVKLLADTIFWYLLYFLPVLGYLLYLIAEPNTGTNLVPISDFFNNIGIGFITDNVIVNTLKRLFGAEGILPLFATNAPFEIFGWFICTYMGHIAVDFILLIPRICHKFMEKFTQRD